MKIAKEEKKKRRKKEKRKKLSIIVISSIFICVFIFLIFLFSGCQPQQQTISGLHIEMKGGAGYIENGKELLEEEPFKVAFELRNYDEETKRGNICIYDNILDVLGGIQQRECKEFFIKEAFKKENQTIPGTQQIVFPSVGVYRYVNLPYYVKTQPVELTIEINYLQDTLFVSQFRYPDPETEHYSFSDRFISLNAKKTVHYADQQYEIFFEIDIRKIGDAEIKTKGINNTINFFFSSQPIDFRCRTSTKQFSQSASIDLEKENFISCLALTYSTEQTTLPFAIRLNYEAIEKRKVNFVVKKR